MTTLPPEDNEQAAGAPGDFSPSASAAPGDPVEPAERFGAPGYVGDEPVGPGSDGSPVPPPLPPLPPTYAAPEQPFAPQQPGGIPGQAPGYPQQPGYGAPQQPPYGAPQQGYYQPQGSPANPLGNLTANYWLSVFFFWIPALIFFLVESPRATAQVRALHAANLNFSLLRTALMVFGWVLMVIPGIGPAVLMLGHLGGFILHIMAAAKVTDTYRSGGTDPFLFNAPMVK